MSEDREDVQKTGISRRRFLGLSARLGGAALLASTGLAEKN
jgi:hypothetical protein